MATPQTQGAIRVRPSRAAADEWDDFAIRCRASFRNAFRAARAWQYEVHWVYRLRRLDIISTGPDGPRKIGQCAVGVGRHACVFADGLQLLPECAAAWPVAMAAVVTHFGAGEYVYGSEWSLEPPRQDELSELHGVKVDSVARTQVQAIDFGRWPTFEAYLADVSTNARRNAKKASKSFPALCIGADSGTGRIGCYCKSVRLRLSVLRRKGVRRSPVGVLARSVARTAATWRYTRSAYLLAGDAVVASYVGVHFGSQFAYLEGASDPEAKGAAWHLLLTMIERAYRQSDGRGIFVMGSDDGTKAGQPTWEGLRRSREQCCATAWPTSVVRFTFRPDAPARVPVSTRADAHAYVDAAAERLAVGR